MASERERADLMEPADHLGRSVHVTRGWLLRVAASAALLALVLWLLPTEGLAAAFAALSLPLFAMILALFLLSHIMAAAKWWFLLGRTIRFPTAVRAHFAGLAANLCLPGVAGGDVVRAGLVAREMDDTARLITVSLVDRLVDIMALGLLTGVGLLLLGDRLLAAFGLPEVSPVMLTAAVGLPVVAGLTAGFLLLPAIARWLADFAGREQASRLLCRAASAIGDVAARRSALAVALTASFAIQAAITLLAIALASGLGVEAPFALWLFAWPLAKIVAVAPISLGGIGVREAGLAGIMAVFGVEAAGVVAASLIWQGVLFATGAIGAGAWLLTLKRSEPDATAVRERSSLRRESLSR